MSANSDTGQYDVLVVGMGAAGLRAAIEASERGARTAVVTLGDDSPNQMGATVTAEFSYCAPLGHADPRDSWEQYLADTLTAGREANDPRLAELLAKDANDRLLDMERYGVKWDKEPDGRFSQAWLQGYTYPRAVHFDYVTGKEMSRGLYRKAQQLNVDIIPFQFAVDILVDGGRAAGLHTICLLTGKPRTLVSSALVLATGGSSQLWELNSNPPGICGDGMAMALRAGAELVDMEFEQFFPSCLVWPPGVRSINFPEYHRGVLRNVNGEAFLPNYGLSEMRDVRDVVAIAIAREIRSGRGTQHGGVYVDYSGTSEASRREFHANQKTRYMRDLGFNPLEMPVEIAPSAHYTLGGVRIGPDCGTSLAGLFACGEVAGGCHGANRLAGNALTETQVFGKIAGESAARYAASSHPDAASRANSEAAPTCCLEAGDDLETRRLTSDLKQVMEEDVKVVRNEAGLLRASAFVKGLRERLAASHGCRREMRVLDYSEVGGLQLRNMVLVAEATVKSALVRWESRGAHYREDLPDEDKAWRGRSVVTWLRDNELKTRVVER